MSARGLLALLWAFCIGATACGSSTGHGQTSFSSGSAVRFAPYVDLTTDRPSLVELVDITGGKDFVLAFVLAGSQRCDPSWGGSLTANDSQVVSEAAALKARGGKVVVASGGATGSYLEKACGSADELAAAYEKVLDAVGSDHLDIDVETDVPVDLVNQALAKLQRDRGTAITYTLPVHRRGLGERSLAILKSAAGLGITSTVNAMVMNFNYEGDWGDAMVGAAEATADNMKSVWPRKSTDEIYRSLGVTAMIGRNDSGMTTTPDNARSLLTFARSHKIGYVGFWSVARDNGKCPGRKEAANNCSGIAQEPYEFSKIFGGHDS